MKVDTRGMSPKYAQHVESTLSLLPPWYLSAGRVREVSLSFEPEVKAMIARYRHGTRDIQVAPDIGTTLHRVLAHEFGHAIDDWTEEVGNPHLFSVSEAWISIHRQQTYFEIPKYRSDPREYFADAVSKMLLAGGRYAIGYPREAEYIGSVVFQQIMGQPST